MSKVNQLIPTIRAQHQIHDLREIKWMSPKQRCSNVPMILPSWQTGPSLPQETAMIDFALVWRCGRRQTESLQRQNTTSPESYVLPMDWAEFDFELRDLFRAPCSAVFAKQAMRLYAPFHKADILICHRLTVYHQRLWNLCWDHQAQMSRGNQSMCPKRSDLTMK